MFPTLLLHTGHKHTGGEYLSEHHTVRGQVRDRDRQVWLKVFKCKSQKTNVIHRSGVLNATQLRQVVTTGGHCSRSNTPRQTDRKGPKPDERQVDRQLQRQTGVPVVDGGVGEEGQVGGELAPDPARKQKQIQMFPNVMPERSWGRADESRSRDRPELLLFLTETSSSFSKVDSLDFCEQKRSYG